MKTIDEISREVAVELGLDLELVESVNRAYWSEIKDEISNPTTDNVRLEGIGTFYIRPKKVITRISKFLLLLKVGRTDDRIDKDSTSNSFKIFWDIKQRFNFRMTNKQWKYVNVKVGYVKYNNCNIDEDSESNDELN